MKEISYGEEVADCDNETYGKYSLSLNTSKDKSKWIQSALTTSSISYLLQFLNSIQFNSRKLVLNNFLATGAKKSLEIGKFCQFD